MRFPRFVFEAMPLTLHQKQKSRVKAEPNTEISTELDMETRHEYSAVKIPRKILIRL